jgi:hypothetical protein
MPSYYKNYSEVVGFPFRKRFFSIYWGRPRAILDIMVKTWCHPTGFETQSSV